MRVDIRPAFHARRHCLKLSFDPGKLRNLLKNRHDEGFSFLEKQPSPATLYISQITETKEFTNANLTGFEGLNGKSCKPLLDSYRISFDAQFYCVKSG